MARFNRRWSPDEVDCFATQWADTDAVDTAMVHACLLEDDERRLRSLCGLLNVGAAALDERWRYGSLAAARDAPVPLCGLCAESGVFGERA